MSESTQSELQESLQKALLELEALKARVSELEKLSGAETAVPAKPQKVGAQNIGKQATPVVQKGITEEEVLAISAAIATWLGVHAHIRQIRLIRSGAWAQQGRVTIQASHRLY